MISVLLPVRDAAGTLEAALASLLEQECGEDVEIVAVDHGSRDASPEILRQAAGRSGRVRIIPSAAPSLPAALNEGLAHCRGEFIARMDADDLCLAGRLEAQARKLRSDPRLGIVGCRVEVFSDRGEVSPGYRAYEAWVNSLVEEADLRRELFIECPLPHPGWMVRRALYEELGGYLDDGLPEDYHLLLRAVQAGWKLGKVPEAGLAWRDHPGRHSRVHARYGRQPFMRLRARFLKALVLGERPCWLWGAGDRGRLLARMLLEEGARLQAVVALSEKGNPPTSVHGLPVWSPEALPHLWPGPGVVCVGAPGARQQIRAWAAARKLEEGKDFWFAS